MFFGVFLGVIRARGAKAVEEKEDTVKPKQKWEGHEQNPGNK